MPKSRVLEIDDSPSGFGHAGPADAAHLFPQIDGESRRAVVDLQNPRLGHLRYHELPGGVLEHGLDFIQG
ncbi:MAG TPA: hypothetical protein EYO17_04610 [Dehalococcoidia bacterium]|nr:hypothetical protein [Dehalococcoidia bacterium]